MAGPARGKRTTRAVPPFWREGRVPGRGRPYPLGDTVSAQGEVDRIRVGHPQRQALTENGTSAPTLPAVVSRQRIRVQAPTPSLHLGAKTGTKISIGVRIAPDCSGGEAREGVRHGVVPTGNVRGNRRTAQRNFPPLDSTCQTGRVGGSICAMVGIRYGRRVVYAHQNQLGPDQLAPRPKALL